MSRSKKEKSDRWSWLPGRSKSGKSKSTQSGQTDFTTRLNTTPNSSFKSRSHNGRSKSLLDRCEANSNTVSEALLDTYGKKFSREYDEWTSETPQYAEDDEFDYILATKSQQVASWMLADAMRRTAGASSNNDKAFWEMGQVMDRVDAELEDASRRGDLTAGSDLEDRVYETEDVMDDFERVAGGEWPMAGANGAKPARSGFSRRTGRTGETERPTALAIVGTAVVFAGVSYLAYKRWNKK